MAADEPQHQPRDALAASIQGTLYLGGAGLFISSIQNTLAKENVTAWGIFSRTGATIGTYAAMGGLYQFARTASANLREKEDSYNNAIGGFLAGSVVGFRFRTFPAILGYGAGAAVLMAAFDYTGGKLTGYNKDPNVDEYERKQQMRKNRRRPVQETIEQLGEGRGIYAPGYQERRQQRIQDNHGVEVRPSANVS